MTTSVTTSSTIGLVGSVGEGISTNVPVAMGSASMKGSTILSGLGMFDTNWLALVIVLCGGAFLFSSFGIARMIRWMTLRRPLPVKADYIGKQVLYRSTARKWLQWPGTMMQKLSLMSFTMPGVPSVGAIILISSWIGFCLLVTLVNVQRDLRGFAYRLP